MRSSKFHLFVCIGFPLLMLTLWPWVAVCQSRIGGVVITADSMDRDGKRKTVTLKGQVQLVFQEHHIYCDEAVIYLESNEIDAKGNVRWTNATVYAEGSHARINYKTELGILFDGFIQSGQVLFEGAVIEKVGEREYIAERGYYTACVTCPPDWSFTGRRIRAELGGYATIQRPVLRLFGVPVFILPAIIVPLKTSRQSGFLVPSWDYSNRGGLALSESYFWAISRSQDATLTAKWYQKRGAKGLGEYRFVLDDNSRGQLNTGWIKDAAFQEESQLDKQIHRWFLKYQHHLELPSNFTQRVDLQPVSDLRYLRDFPDEFPGNGDAALENKISLTKSSERHFASIEAGYYTNLLKTYPLADNDDAVHRFPEIRYSLTERRLWGKGPTLRLDSQYVNFSRSGFSYDDLTLSPEGRRSPTINNKGSAQRDGNFDPMTDLIRTGQRLDVQPAVSYPFHVGQFLDVLPSVSYRETQYQFSLDEEQLGSFAPSAARRYIETNLVARTEFNRIYGDMNQPRSTRYKHLIEPEVTFSSIPWARSPNHDFFGTFTGQRFDRSREPVSDKDLDGVNKIQFDYHDRLFDRRYVDFALSNRVTRRKWNKAGVEYKSILNWKVSQSYDINEAKTSRPQPWSPIRSLLDVRLDHFETYTGVSFNPYAKLWNTSARLRVLADTYNYIEFSYIKNSLVDEENSVVPASRTENLGLGLGFKSRYLDLVGRVDYSSTRQTIQSWEYTAYLHPPGNCWVIRFQQRQVLGGDMQFGMNFNFIFGG